MQGEPNCPKGCLEGMIEFNPYDGEWGCLGCGGIVKEHKPVVETRSVIPSLTVDAHLDVPWVMHKHGKFDLAKGNPEVSAVSFPQMKVGGLDAAFFALYLSDMLIDRYGPEGSWKAILEQVDVVRNQLGCKIIQQSRDVWLTTVTSAVPIFLGLEGGRFLEGNLGRIKTLKALGVRYVTLCHNQNNELVDSATDRPRHRGLTKLGYDVVKALNEANIFADVSHVSEASALEVCKVSSRPVLATHSGSKVMYDHERNLSDELCKAIAKTGGMVCVPFVKRFIGKWGVGAHVKHIGNLIGIDRVGIGSDLDGAQLVEEVKTVSDWAGYLADQLYGVGLNTREWKLVAGDNLLNRLFG